MKLPDVVTFEHTCPKCGSVYKIYAKLSRDPKIDKDYKKKGFTPFPKDAKIICKCGFVIDLLGHKNRIEMLTRKKIIV